MITKVSAVEEGSFVEDARSNAKRLGHHVVEHLSTAGGLGDAVKVVNYATQWFMQLAKAFSGEAVGRLRKITDATAAVLDLPYLCSAVGRLVKTLCEWRESQASSQAVGTNPGVGSVLESGLSCVNAVADAAGNLHSLEVLDLGKSAPVVSGVFHASNIALEGKELMSECRRVQENIGDRSLSNSQEKNVRIQRDSRLSMIRIAKCVASIVGSILAGIGLCVTVGAGAAAILPVAGLLCSSVWLVCKIAAHFYEKMALSEHREFQGASLL